MKWILPLIFLIIFESIADIFAVKWSENQILRLGIAAIIFYIICNIFWLFSLKNGSWLWRWALIFSVSSASLSIIIWMFLFNETFTTLQMIWIWLWLVSIVFMVI